MSATVEEKPGPGFALFGLLTGLAAGTAVYAIAEFWIDASSEPRLAVTTLTFVMTFAAALLLLAERAKTLRAVPSALAIAAIIAAPTWYFFEVTDGGTNLDPFPAMFWFMLGGPLAAYLMTTLAKASLGDRFPPDYTGVFFHGLTLPLIAVAAHVFAVLALTLVFVWALLLRSLEIDFFHRLFQEPWFLLPAAGAIGGLSIAMIRGMQSVLGALRFILLGFCRIVMPITAVLSVTLILVLAIKGPEPIFAMAYPSGIMLGLAFTGMLIFNGVYQNGEGDPPPAWLRLSTIVMLATFPVYAGLAAYAFWLRVGEYGLTPPRIFGVAISALAALYTIVCAAGLLTELNWRGKRWMPLVAPLNTAMAMLWIAVLLALASPLVNAWAMSAKSQELRLATGRVPADEFDYGYMRFRLGHYGEAALDRLYALESHTEAAAIRAGIDRARAANSIYEYEHPEAYPDVEELQPAPAAEGPADGPMGLELNPDGAPPESADPAAPPPAEDL